MNSTHDTGGQFTSSIHDIGDQLITCITDTGDRLITIVSKIPVTNLQLKSTPRVVCDLNIDTTETNIAMFMLKCVNKKIRNNSLLLLLLVVARVIVKKFQLNLRTYYTIRAPLSEPSYFFFLSEPLPV
jgi:hypothetical protein